MNARNAVISELNPRRAVIEAKDKLLTKRRLGEAGLPVAPTIAELRTPHQVRRLDLSSLPDDLVAKPARGSQGRGVLVVCGGVDPAGFRRHAADIVDGRFSDEDDVAMIEPLLRPRRDLADVAPIGLPDIRIVCRHEHPLMAMLRMPTAASGGVGNLHRGGLGAAVDLGTGVITRVVASGVDIERHPDTGTALLGRSVPEWGDVIDIARRCAAATGLGYLGIDVVLDEHRGPVILEVNSHPGLEIQNVNGESLLAGATGR
ncbi:MAG: sugar-transfer associated ATP-grasp domain-containing protein [Actinomycetota bacterium]